MAKVKNLEKKIWNVEGFDVNILHPDGRDDRGDPAHFSEPYCGPAVGCWAIFIFVPQERCFFS
jgi:hypothetical protein